MKKLLALLLSLMMLFSLASLFAGCEDSGKKKKSSSSSRDDEDEDEDEDEEKDDSDEDNKDEDDADSPTDEEGSETEPDETLPLETMPPETTPEATRGNQEGDLCYSYNLTVADENGVTGETIDPTATGKVTLINFWGTWCGPCVNEMPHLDELTKKYDVCVIAVHSVTGQEAMPDYIRENFADSNIIFAYDGTGSAFSGEYYTMMGDLGFYPYSILLDENGYIVQLIQGAVDYNFISNAVKEAGASPVSLLPTVDNVTVQDGYYTILTSELAGDYAPKCFHIPEILVNDTALSNVNEQLTDELLPKAEEYELQNMTYQWWYKGDILSILVRFSWVFNDAVSYQVYNISLSQDKILDDGEFCDAMGIRMHDAMTSLAAFLQEHCDSLTPSEYMDQATIDWMIKDTMSEENLSGSQFFLGADGQINYVTKIAVPAGSGWSVRLYSSNGDAYYINADSHKSCG